MLFDFEFCNPTKIYFGKNSLDKLEEELNNYGKNILLVYGGGSIKTFGLYDKVILDSVINSVTSLEFEDMVLTTCNALLDKDGIFYHHILNAETGYPCETNLLQVSIISKDSATGDALSTSCFALGLEKGMALINSLPDVYAAFITADGKLHFSNGFLETIPTQTE